MKATVINGEIVIDGTDSEIKYLAQVLSYKDKQKEYQLKKMQQNPYLRNSVAYKNLLKESQGSLINQTSPTQATTHLGFAHKLIEMDIPLSDSRSLKEHTISLPWKNSNQNITLRPYQREAIDLIKKEHRGIINFATGMGKSKTAIVLIKELKLKTLLIAPSESIAKQLFNELKDLFGDSVIGYLGGGKDSVENKKIVVAIGASAINKTELLKSQGFDLIIFDEAHRTPCDTFFKVAEALKNTNRIYGLTATPFRADGKDLLLEAVCGKIIVQRDAKWGIENGFLSPPVFVMRRVNTSDCADFKDDKLKSYKAHVLNNPTMKNLIESDAKHYLDKNKSVLILVDQVEHGKELSKNLGIPFATGTDAKSNEYVAQLNDGKVKGLIGTDGKIGEGTDTRNVDVLILCNFVASKGAVLQCIGRALRLKDGKDKAIIIDYSPEGSTMLKRHANMRLSYYREITDQIKMM